MTKSFYAIPNSRRFGDMDIHGHLWTFDDTRLGGTPARTDLHSAPPYAKRHPAPPVLGRDLADVRAEDMINIQNESMKFFYKAQVSWIIVGDAPTGMPIIKS